MAVIKSEQGSLNEMRNEDILRIHELHYSTTNTYLIEGNKGKLLFDTGWAGTFQAFCKAVKEAGVSVQEIDYLMISHFHPDHMGIAQEIADQGTVIVVLDLQREFVHNADKVFAKEKGTEFVPIDDSRLRVVTIDLSRDFLKELGIDGEVIASPGHSDDSISLYLDEGYLFVGDLNPLYELELHKGTQIEESWKKLLTNDVKTVYYGHAKKAVLKESGVMTQEERESELHPGSEDKSEIYSLVSKIMKLIDKGCDMKKIRKKTGADEVFIDDVMRMYLTHQNVGVQGILDRIEIKNK